VDEPKPSWSDCSSERPCRPLFDNFAKTIDDRGRWPDHLCLDVARYSVYLWATLRVAATAPQVRWWRTLWPLPIGRRAIERAAAHWYTLSEKEPCPEGLAMAEDLGKAVSRALPWTPFLGDERAFFVATVKENGATIDLFGLSDAGVSLPYIPVEVLGRRGGQAPPQGFYQAGPLVPVPGGFPSPKLALADLWWREHIQGRPLRGRRRLEHDLDGAWHVAVRKALLRKKQYPLMSWEQIAAFLGVAGDVKDRTRKLRRWRRRHEKSGCHCAD
jgi:hypothetical protein